MLRRGRFDELFFVDLPSEAEREEIINLYVKRNLLNPPSTTTLGKLVEISDGFAGADLEKAARDVAIQAVIHGDSVVDDALFEKCFRNVVLLSKTAPEKIEAIRIWGRERAVPASGISWDVSPNDKVIGKRSIII